MRPGTYRLSGWAAIPRIQVLTAMDHTFAISKIGAESLRWIAGGGFWARLVVLTLVTTSSCQRTSGPTALALSTGSSARSKEPNYIANSAIEAFRGLASRVGLWAAASGDELRFSWHPYLGIMYTLVLRDDGGVTWIRAECGKTETVGFARNARIEDGIFAIDWDDTAGGNRPSDGSISLDERYALCVWADCVYLIQISRLGDFINDVNRGGPIPDADYPRWCGDDARSSAPRGQPHLLSSLGAMILEVPIYCRILDATASADGSLYCAVNAGELVGLRIGMRLYPYSNLRGEEFEVISANQLTSVVRWSCGSSGEPKQPSDLVGVELSTQRQRK